MSGFQISRAKIVDGVWEGILLGPASGVGPEIEVLHERRTLDGVSLTPDSEMPGLWILRVSIPADLICDGVQTFLITDKASGAMLDRFMLAAGRALDGDLRAEVDFLRAELDLLKAEFREYAAREGTVDPAKAI